LWPGLACIDRRLPAVEVSREMIGEGLFLIVRIAHLRKSALGLPLVKQERCFVPGIPKLAYAEHKIIVAIGESDIIALVCHADFGGGYACGCQVRLKSL